MDLGAFGGANGQWLGGWRAGYDTGQGDLFRSAGRCPTWGPHMRHSRLFCGEASGGNMTPSACARRAIPGCYPCVLRVEAGSMAGIRFAPFSLFTGVEPVGRLKERAWMPESEYRDLHAK